MNLLKCPESTFWNCFTYFVWIIDHIVAQLSEVAWKKVSKTVGETLILCPVTWSTTAQLDFVYEKESLDDLGYGADTPVCTGIRTFIMSQYFQWWSSNRLEGRNTKCGGISLSSSRKPRALKIIFTDFNSSKCYSITQKSKLGGKKARYWRKSFLKHRKH